MISRRLQDYNLVDSTKLLFFQLKKIRYYNEDRLIKNDFYSIIFFKNSSKKREKWIKFYI